MTPSLVSLGETGLLSLIRKRFLRQKYPSLILGPGDDAALSKLRPGHILVSTQDDLAEGAHFERGWTDFRRLAHKLLRINLSDLAAMGAVAPVGVLVSACFPPDASLDWAKEFLKGLAEDAARFKVAVLGGNLSGGERLFFSMTALGQAKPGRILKRSGAKAGDLVAGVGPVGEAARGLSDLRAGRRSGRFARAFWEPEPQLKAARILAEKKLATSLIDNSDGLVHSCRLLAQEAGLGVRLDLSRKLWQAGQDGEDYGLVFTVRPSLWPRVARLLPKAYRLGAIVGGKGGAQAAGGFEHFR